MADTKVSALAATGSVLATDEFPINTAGTSKKATASQIRQYVGTGLNNAATAAVAAAYAVDTYLAGSAITIPTAGGWRVGTIYRCQFDMSKTAAGVAAFTIIVRMGTLGTTGDAAICTVAFGIGTAAGDLGLFTVLSTFRTIGAGTAAVLKTTISCAHNLAGTGLTTTGTGGVATVGNTSAGFNSTTQTIIGISVNGGAAFSGTTETVVATADKI